MLGSCTPGVGCPVPTDEGESTVTAFDDDDFDDGVDDGTRTRSLRSHSPAL